jgi:hypothetical protein
MKLRVVACEIFFREICLLASGSPHICDLDFLPKGLHDLGVDKMRPRIQERIDAADTGDYDAILLAYGLCNNGVVGLSTRKTRLVIPKAHDCITVFMGSRDRYRKIFSENPGTYYFTSGWLERNDPTRAGDVTVQQKLGLFCQYEELLAKYGEDNARYLMETMGDATAHYSRVVFIRMGLEGEQVFENLARQRAAENGWTFEAIDGSLSILRKLLHGDWDRDVLVVEPGRRIAPTHDAEIVGVAQA